MLVAPSACRSVGTVCRSGPGRRRRRYPPRRQGHRGDVGVIRARRATRAGQPRCDTLVYTTDRQPQYSIGRRVLTPCALPCQPCLEISPEAVLDRAMNRSCTTSEHVCIRACGQNKKKGPRFRESRDKFSRVFSQSETVSRQERSVGEDVIVAVCTLRNRKRGSRNCSGVPCGPRPHCQSQAWTRSFPIQASLKGLSRGGIQWARK